MVQEHSNLTIVVTLFLSLIVFGCMGTQPPDDNQTNDSNNISINVSTVTIVDAGIGTDIFETTQNTTENPIENIVPNASPVGNGTNPLKDVYTNPFG